MKQEYSVNQAFDQAKKYCNSNPGWVRVCDLDDDIETELRFDELPKKEQNYWVNKYPFSAEDMYMEYSEKTPRYPYKFVTGRGDVVFSINDIPVGHQSVQIFKIR